MIYFIIVTIATVGYGDITPKTDLGRLFVMSLIIVELVLIPKQTNELLRLMNMQSVYARNSYKSNSEVPHLLVCGMVLQQPLENFCKELFHPDHGTQDKNAVILQQENPKPDMEIFLRKPQYELFLTYLQGNPMQNKDLFRAAVTTAKAAILLTNKRSQDPQAQDHKNILTGLALQKFVHYYTGKSIRLCMQLIKPESKTHYYSSLNTKSNDQLIIVEEIKMNLLAKSCFSPGIIAMISNIVRSAGDPPQEENQQQKWLYEYKSGMVHEIYRSQLSRKFTGLTFSDTAWKVYYQCDGGILFAIELDVAGETIIRLNPGDYVIPDVVENNVHGYIICPDKKIAEKAATWGLNAEEINKQNQEIASKNKKQHAQDLLLKTLQNKLLLRDNQSQKKVYEELQMHDSSGSDSEEGSFNKETEDGVLEQDFILHEEVRTPWDMIKYSIQDQVEIQNHIVVCGLHPSIYYFLLPLRAKYLKDSFLQWIIILNPNHPDTDIMECISRFPQVYYIKGNPLIHEDLLRANIEFADKAVILGQDPKEDVQDEMTDADSIFIYKAIKQANPNIQIMAELVYSSNIEFLLPKESRAEMEFDGYEVTPLFAAGEVYISSTIDTLTCQAYYNPHIVTILQQLLTSGNNVPQAVRAMCEYSELKQSNLWQIPVPEDYINQTWLDLFQFLTLEKNLVPLGLYRMEGARDNKHAYVYTNPLKTTKLTHKDKIFVLGCHMQKEDQLAALPDQKQQPQSQSNMSKLTSFAKKNQNQQKEMTQKEKGRHINNFTELADDRGSTATLGMINSINKEIVKMHEDLEDLKSNLKRQDEQIVEKIKVALRQELSTLTQ